MLLRSGKRRSFLDGANLRELLKGGSAWTLASLLRHFQAMLQRIPFGRYGQPLDVARVVLFFASPLSDYVTGQEINVSGGMQIP